MDAYGIWTEYEATGGYGRCCMRACPYPGRESVVFDRWSGEITKRVMCWWHFLVGAFPFSMEYEDADALLCIPRSQRRRVVRELASVRDQQSWDHVRVAWLTRATRTSYRRAKIQVAREAVADGRLTHYLDPVYNQFTELRRSMVYTMCGEKVLDSLTVGFSLDPTCKTCLTMHRIKVAQLPEVPLRVSLQTPPKPRTEKPSFEVLLLDGLIEDSAFQNRRNWGERNGRTWNDKSKGAQKDRYLRWDRGGVNRKRG